VEASAQAATRQDRYPSSALSSIFVGVALRIVTISMDAEVLERLDVLAEQIGYVKSDGTPNRSAAVRHLVERATGTTAAQAAVAEEVVAIHRRLRERAGPIAERVREVIVEELAVGE